MTDIDAEIQALHRAHPAKSGMVFNIAVTLLEVGGTLLLFRLARNAGASEVAAYMAGCIAPIAGALVIWARSRKFSGASAAILAFALLSAAIALIGSTQPKVLLYKDCASTAAVGLVFAGSILFRRPLTFYFAQRWGTDGTRDGMRVFDLMWKQYPTFRRGTYRITLVWAAVLLIQAAVTVAIIAATPFDTAFVWDQVLPPAAIAIAICITVFMARRMQAEGERAGAERRGHQSPTG